MRPAPPRTHAAPGELPEFWDRSTIFFANLRSLFHGNEGCTQELISAIAGIDSYGGRLVPIVNLLFRDGESVLVLEREPVEGLLQYFQNALGLVLPRIEVLSSSEYDAFSDPEMETPAVIERIRALDVPWVDGFVTDLRLAEVARALDRRTIASLDGSRDGNNKYLLHAHLESLGLPVFDTELAANAADVWDAVERLRKRGYARAVVKSQVGASGIGLVQVDATDPGATPLPDYLFETGPAMIQGWLDEQVIGISNHRSPSVQLFLNDTDVYLYDITEQILSADSVHEGNAAPPDYLDDGAALQEELLSQATVAATWLHGRGYRGTASVDFLVVDRHGKPEARVCEVNARVTGATYPSVLARHFAGDGCWLMRNLRLRSVLEPNELLQTLDGAKRLYMPGETRGVIPINLNLDADEQVTKGQFLCLAPTLDACEEELHLAQAALPVDFDFDRD